MTKAIEEPTMPRSPRAVDVAKVAGVSQATVSRTFNEPDKVQPHIRQRVLAAAESLGWLPHGAGSALARRRSLIAGALIPTLANGIFATHVAALQEVFSDAGINLIVSVSNHDPAQAMRSTQAMLARGVEAITVVGEDFGDPIFDLMAARRVPYVITHGFNANSRHPTIGIDNFKTFQEITNYLLSLGHTTVGMIAPPQANNARVEARVGGVRDALAAAGLGMRPKHFIEGPWSIQFGRDSLAAILAAGSPTPTAIICGNDQIAFGVLTEARARGISIPNDLSIIGFDDDPIAQHTTPPLTSVKVDRASMGQEAALYLLARLRGEMPDLPPPMQAKLIVRGSTAPAKR
ncbi:substrate-binding domain-containing protein [Phyllobacterium sp. 21LDTY02-6]|uniref:LacI family DNA-binding transcriptional regulator n=1 Tax=Phyllobacterium sp. 21LDTY02-6 TaxID=2944903 RepID=UPI002021899D|nr:substrate-binding domain-containing protein [Phyllobacterium sp. 21LDTY02-6]MCO4319082.1 substrate-binding domain-containing protein [Phyllobacterium sp. 21LDTY02-6]